MCGLLMCIPHHSVPRPFRLPRSPPAQQWSPRPLISSDCPDLLHNSGPCCVPQVASGAQISFAQWSSQKNAERVKSAGSSPVSAATPSQRRRSSEGRSSDPYRNIVNCDLIGAALKLVYDRALEVLRRGEFLLTIGGDHSIATSTISAVKQVYPEVCVVWIDAHGDANTPGRMLCVD